MILKTTLSWLLFAPRRAPILLLLLLFGTAAWAQAPNWQTLTAATHVNSRFSLITATAADASGNVYVAGYFFGTIALGSTTLVSASPGSTDVFVAKWSPASNAFVWAQRAGGTGDEYATAVAVSGSSVYVAGNFRSPTATFGTTTLTKAGTDPLNSDIFVAKLTDAGPSGSFGWAQRAGGSDYDDALALAVSGGSVYVVGNFFSASAGFGPVSLTNASPNDADAFVAKLTDAGASGSFVWAQRAGGAGGDAAAGVAVSGSSVYIGGWFRGATAGFGATTLVNADPGGGFSKGSEDVFVAKLTDAGPTASFGWAQRAGGADDDAVRALAATPAGVYVAGRFTSASASFGSVALANAGGSTNGLPNDDVFVARLTDAGASGSFAWAQRAGGTGVDFANAIAATGANVYVAGIFGGASASFGPTALANAGGTAGGSAISDVFVTRLVDAGASGSFAWAQRAGGADFDVAAAVAVSGTSVLVAGYSAPPASFGPLAMPGPAANQIAYLASLPDVAALATLASEPLAALVLFPNPARGAATVRVPAVPGAVQATLAVVDALGRTVRAHTVALPPAGATVELSVAGLVPGLYRLQVQAGALRASRSFAVE